ncbi:MAG: EscU/YscU/HrcU family type III secretion system export apparatus switch protein, partial [Planctomycetota bacterium]
MPQQNDEAEEKTEEPSERKREKAREQGQVAQSSELNNVAVLAAALLGLWLLGQRMGRLLTERFTRHLGGLAEFEVDPQGVVAGFRGIALSLCGVLLPFAVAIAGTAAVLNVMQTKFNVSWQKIQPSFDQVNPVQGAQRLFSWSSLVRMLIALGKMGVVIGVTVLVVRAALPSFTGVIGRGAEAVLKVCADLTFRMLLWVTLAMAAIALADYAYQRYRHRQQLMMTKTEKKEERKQQEGRPEVEEKQDEKRKEMSERRMMQDVPDADVVVTNPTHVAVALQWD